MTAASIKRAYPGLLAAARINDGLVVASYGEVLSQESIRPVRGLYLRLVDIDGYIDTVEGSVRLLLSVYGTYSQSRRSQRQRRFRFV